MKIAGWEVKILSREKLNYNILARKQLKKAKFAMSLFRHDNKTVTSLTNLPWYLVMPLVFSVISIFLGYLVTALFPSDLHSWRYVVGARLIFEVSSIVWFGTALGVLYGSSNWKVKIVKSIIISLGISLLICYNPVLDMIDGPVQWKGKLTSESVYKGTMYRSGGGTSPTIWAQARVVESNGIAHDVKTSGLQTNRWIDFTKECGDENNPEVYIVYLKHLHIPLDGKCLNIIKE